LESPKIAADILDGMEKHIKSLESMPRRFPTVPEKINYKNYSIHHFFYKKSFRVIYTIYGDTVRILDVRHSARDYVLESDVE
jgi:plasmid stabilization system protein ParE